MRYLVGPHLLEEIGVVVVDVPGRRLGVPPTWGTRQNRTRTQVIIDLGHTGKINLVQKANRPGTHGKIDPRPFLRSKK